MEKSKSMMVWRTLLVLFIAFFWGGSLNAYAAKKAWVKYADGTLIFQYSEKTKLGTDEYDLNVGNQTPRWSEKKADVTTVVFFSSFAQARPTSCYRWFYDFSNLSSINGISYLNTQDVTNMSRMFYRCEKLTSLNLSNFNTSKVTDMSFMFYDCSGLTSLNVSKFNTSIVTDMKYMFYNCFGLTSLDVSHFDTSKVTDMGCMFWNCYRLTALDVSNFVTSEVGNLFSMFNNCSGLTSLDVSKFDTSNVTSMGYMFYDCHALTSLDVSNFNTSEVTYMSSMFRGCTGLTTLDLSNFDTSKVTDMSLMFKDSPNLETIYASDKFVTSGITEAEKGKDLFTNCKKLVGLIVYDESKTDKAYATVDGGYFMDKEYTRPWVKYADGTLTFQYGYKKTLGTDEYLLNEGSYVTEWGSKYSSIKTVVFDKTFSQARPTSCYSWFDYCSNLSAIKGIENLNTSNVTNMNKMFYDCSGLTSLDVSNFDTSNVTNMNKMFYDCSGLTSLDVSNFNTSKVTDMSFMFYDCSGLTSLNVSKFDTSNVTSMSFMFEDCSRLTSLDVSNFNTSNVTYMSSMFYGCYRLTSLDVSNFNTSKVMSMSSMFNGCSRLTSLDVSNFDTSKVMYMSSMFRDCSGLTSLDLSNFDTSKVKEMSSMFFGCFGLTSLDLSNFDTSNTTDMKFMFGNCLGLTSLDLSNFDISNTTDMTLMFMDNSKLNAIYWSDKFDADQLSSITHDFMFRSCPATLYCSPKQYESFRNNSVIVSFGNAVKPYVGINQKSEYGTLCVPVGSSLAEDSFTGFDKLYQVTNADKDKGTITLAEAKSIEPGVPYVYHRYLEGVDFESKAEESSSESSSAAKALMMSIITFDVDENASAAVTAPKNEGSLLKGTFESMVAIGGSYILQTDGNFHPVAEGNKTLKVGAYRAYLDLPSLGEGGAEISAKAYHMVFEDGEATGIDRINGEGTDGSDKGVYDQADQQPKVYFDLMGRRVNAPLKGEIYIVNGKKVVYNNKK